MLAFYWLFLRVGQPGMATPVALEIMCVCVCGCDYLVYIH